MNGEMRATRSRLGQCAKKSTRRLAAHGGNREDNVDERLADIASEAEGDQDGGGEGERERRWRRKSLQKCRHG
ncbi:hypothetical protein U1Q18_029706 [Sarracenia purpurea var. burkii]